MTKVLNFLLKVTGYAQWWHVAWVSHIAGEKRVYADTVLRIAPRLTEEAIRDVRGHLAGMTSQGLGVTVESAQIVITSMTRIGR